MHYGENHVRPLAILLIIMTNTHFLIDNYASTYLCIYIKIEDVTIYLLCGMDDNVF